jgi:hypothetical protein
MKIGNIILATIFLITGAVFSSFSLNREQLQRFFQRSPETRANMITGVMKSKLDLTDDQFEKAYLVNLKYAKLSDPYLSSEDSARKNREKLVGINKQRKEELKAILTPEQIEKAESIRKQWIDRLETILNQLRDDESH